MATIPDRLRLSSGSPSTEELTLAINTALREVRAEVSSLTGKLQAALERIVELEAEQVTAADPVAATTFPEAVPASSSAGYGRGWTSAFGFGFSGGEYSFGWAASELPAAFGSGFGVGMRT